MRLWTMASALVLGGCMRQPAMFSAPRLAGDGPLIEREQVEIRCTGDKARVRCEADGDYRLEPTERASRATISSRRATTRIEHPKVASSGDESDPALSAYLPPTEPDTTTAGPEPAPKRPSP